MEKSKQKGPDRRKKSSKSAAKPGKYVNNLLHLHKIQGVLLQKLHKELG